MSNSFRYLLLDLDDTLAPEWDFVSGGYRSIAIRLGKQYGIPAHDIFNLFVYEHHKYGRYKIIDRVIEALNLDSALIPDLARIYRNHTPAIDFYPGVQRALERLIAAGYHLAVVTDGEASIQRRKAKVLGLERYIQTIIYCSEVGAPKPEIDSFEIAMNKIGAVQNETLIVGDDPYLDIMAAATLRIHACRVRTGRYGLVEHDNLPVIADFSTFSEFAFWLVQNPL